MKKYDWFKVLIYLFLWIFSWTLFDKICDKLELSDDDIIKICIFGLLIIILIIQNNSDIHIS